MLILASASPRRRELLLQVGLAHEVVPAHIDETRRECEDPVTYVRRLALSKARAVAERRPGEVVLAADTTVALQGMTLNKPVDLREAEQMLRALADGAHEVHTGVAVARGNEAQSHVETTTVWFTAIEEAELAAYLATGDSMDKAGAYGIQGYAGRWVRRIEGDYTNVVGLPLASTMRLLRAFGAA